MLSRERAACVLHVADVADGEALELLCRTTQVIAAAGVEQVLLVLARDPGPDLVWTAALAAEVRPLRCSSPSLFGRIRWAISNAFNASVNSPRASATSPRSR